MGFKKIYLIGFDYDYIISRRQNHFYEEQDRGYSSNDLFVNYSNLELAENLYDYLKRLDIIHKSFQKENIQVFNAGIGGMTDTFPRVDYNSLFQK